MLKNPQSCLFTGHAGKTDAGIKPRFIHFFYNAIGLFLVEHLKGTGSEGRVIEKFPGFFVKFRHLSLLSSAFGGSDLRPCYHGLLRDAILSSMTIGPFYGGHDTIYQGNPLK